MSSTLRLPTSEARHTAPLAKPALPPMADGPAGSLNSCEILQGQKAIAIQHNGATYRLQSTRLGKLILTK